VPERGDAHEGLAALGARALDDLGDGEVELRPAGEHVPERMRLYAKAKNLGKAPPLHIDLLAHEEVEGDVEVTQALVEGKGALAAQGDREEAPAQPWHAVADHLVGGGAIRRDGKAARGVAQHLPRHHGGVAPRAGHERAPGRQ